MKKKKYMSDEDFAELLLSLEQALQHARGGKGFPLLEEDAEVSPEKAAEMLRISRHRLLKKLDGGEIPFHYVGSHRRIAVADVLAYRSKQKERAQTALRQLRDEDYTWDSQ
jgi:excisionase family DNA binding protein